MRKLGNYTNYLTPMAGKRKLIEFISLKTSWDLARRKCCSGQISQLVDTIGKNVFECEFPYLRILMKLHFLRCCRGRNGEGVHSNVGRSGSKVYLNHKLKSKWIYISHFFIADLKSWFLTSPDGYFKSSLPINGNWMYALKQMDNSIFVI